MKTTWLSLAAVLSSSLLLCAAQPKSAAKPKTPAKPKPAVAVSSPQVKTGERVTFTFSGLTAEAQYKITFHGEKSLPQPQSVKADKSGKVTVLAALKKPGFIRCVISGTGITAATGGAAVEPEKVKPARLMPKDFENFWAAEKAILNKTPLAPELKELKKGTICEYDLTLPCPGSKTPVRGILALKAGAKAKSLPALLLVDGAGVYQTRSPSGYARDGFLALHINAHGIPTKMSNAEHAAKKKELNGYACWGMTDRKSTYFYGMLLRVYRALQYLQSRPEWNGKILAVTGSSQGGLQSIAAAGLEPKVTAIAAYVPAGCDHGGKLAGRDDGWPHFRNSREWSKLAPADREKVHPAMDYVDMVNFARLIKNADVFMSTGLIDTTCPSSSVFAAYNSIPSAKKQMQIDPAATHSVPKTTSLKGKSFLYKHAGLKK